MTDDDELLLDDDALLLDDDELPLDDDELLLDEIGQNPVVLTCMQPVKSSPVYSGSIVNPIGHGTHMRSFRTVHASKVNELF